MQDETDSATDGTRREAPLPFDSTAGNAGGGETEPPMSPGDEAAEGTPGTGENVCEHCGGSGRDRDGKTCPVCDGSGKVITGIGGG